MQCKWKWIEKLAVIRRLAEKIEGHFVFFFQYLLGIGIISYLGYLADRQV